MSEHNPLEHILPTSRGHGLPTDPPARKSKRKVKAKRAAKPKTEKAAAPAAGEFAGITAKDCPAGCTAERCAISTVGVCAHPYKSAVNGFGPITMANRERARKLIKHQMVDLKG